MALKDIFTMIKADRYTADGCDEIKKAQEAIKEETVDAGLPDGTMRHRKDGDYIKQAGKWVPAKKANGGAKKNGPDMNAEKAKHAEARKDRESAGAKQDLPADLQKQAQEYVAWEKPEVIQRYINNLRKPFSIERDSFKEPDKLAEALERELKKKTESKPAESKPADTPSYWIQDPRGNRLTNGDAIERIKTNKKEIERLKTSDEPRADMKIRDLTNMNEYLSERLKPEDRKETEESKPEEKKTYLNENGGRNHRAALEENPTDAYDFEKTVQKSIPMSQGDKEELQHLKSFMREEHTDYKQALISRATSLVDGHKVDGDWYPEKEKSIMKIAKAVGYDKDLHKFIEEEFRGYDLGYSEDAAPRVLTGDCKIRIRKSK